MSNYLLAEYSRILKTGDLYDIDIAVGKEPNIKTFHLHSFILKVCSPYFHDLLSNKQQLKMENGIIKHREESIPADVFEIIIK
jgi:hypothetical protein